MARQKANKPPNPAYEKFCQHYAEYANATQAYLFAFPNIKYSTAGTEGPKLLGNPAIKERIEQLQDEFKTQYKQTKEGTIRDLINAAEEAKKAFQFPAYAKLREMVIKMCGFYEPDRIEHSGNVGINIAIVKPDDEPEDKI